MLRVVIVDDEPLARDCMRLALAPVRDVTIVAECEDGVAAVEAIVHHAPDIVFLDVQMPGLDGFGVIARIGVDAMPQMVFVTAFDAHAIRAFEVHALDYVLKPFDDQRLLSALKRARTQVAERRHGALGRQLADLMRGWNAGGLNGGGAAVSTSTALDSEFSPSRARPIADPPALPLEDDEDVGPVGEDEGLRESRSFLSRFAVRNDDSIRFVPVTDVDWIEADRNYIVVHAGDMKHRVRASLSHVMERLDPRLFMRIHRSVVVQTDRIREVQPWFGGDYVAILRDGTKLRVSRQRAPHLLRPLG